MSDPGPVDWAMKALGRSACYATIADVLDIIKKGNISHWINHFIREIKGEMKMRAWKAIFVKTLARNKRDVSN